MIDEICPPVVHFYSAFPLPIQQNAHSFITGFFSCFLLHASRILLHQLQCQHKSRMSDSDAHIVGISFRCDSLADSLQQWFSFPLPPILMF